MYMSFFPTGTLDLLFKLACTLAVGAACSVMLPAPQADAASVPPIERPLIFTDSFNSGRLDGWAVEDEGTNAAPSRWQIENFQLVQRSNIYGGSAITTSIDKPGSNIVTGNPKWGNYNISLLFRTFDDDDLGVVFRYRDRNNYYRFSMNKQTGYQRLVKKVNGTYTLLAQRSVGYATNTRYKLDVSAVGDRLRVYVDDAEIFDVGDTSLATGRIGLYTWGSNHTVFDSFRAETQLDDHFTIVVVPDTQFASEAYPAILHSQMRWIAAGRDDHNVAMVLQEGDIVDEMQSPAQWNNAKQYYRYLSSKVPFVIAAGNHDLHNSSLPRPDRYVPRPAAYNDFIRSLPNYSAHGTYQPGDYRNSYYLFSASGIDMMIINLEYGAPDDVLAWARTTVARYPDRHAMMLTHDYLGEDNKHRGEDPTDLYLPKTDDATRNNGIDTWNKFVRLQSNVQFTFNGHVITPKSEAWPHDYSVGSLVSQNDAGRPVYQTLTNYQSWRPAGRGYLRMFKVYPAESRVDVITYSPYENRFLRDPLNQFSYTGVDLGSWRD